MPRFEPFPGIRYAADLDPALVTAPPYDVIDAEDRVALLARSPRNAVAVDLPDEADGPGRYDAAARTIREWRADGTLVTDEVPSFTAYQMRFTDDRGRPARTLGVVGALALSRPDEGEILPHEHTTPKAKTDRLDLLRATGIDLSPVWMLSLAQGLTDLLDRDDEPEATWTDGDGVEHSWWRIDDPERVAAISATVASAPVVVADGHHRFATALEHRDERLAAGGALTPEAEMFMTLVVELTDDELTVRPIHRVIDGADAPALVELLTSRGFTPGDSVDAEEVADGRVLERMAEHRALAVVAADGSARLMVPEPGRFEDLDDLDSARLAHALDGLDLTVRYQHGVDLVARAVARGEADAGVLIGPATVAQIEDNAHAGRRMPPKTTFFHPKPRTGVVFRSC